MAESLGSIYAEFRLKLDGLQKDVASAQSSLENSGKAVTDFGKGMTALVTGPALALGAGMVALAVKTGNYADRVLDLSDITGLSTDSIQAWQYVADQAGVSTETMTNVSQKLTKQMSQMEDGTGKSGEALDKLGIHFEELNDASPEERLDRVVAGLQDIDDPAERARVGTELLGNEFEDLAPILGIAEDELADLLETGGEYATDRGALETANEFRQSMEELKAQLGSATRELATNLIPILQDVFLPIIQDHIIPAIEKFIGFLGDLAEKFLDLDDKTKKIILGVTAFLVALGPMLIVVGQLMRLFSKLMPIVNVIITGVKLLVGAFAAIFSPVGLIIAAVVALIAVFIYLWNTNEDFRDKVIEIWETIKEKAVEIWEGLTEFFLNAWDTIKGYGEALWDEFGEYIMAAWDSIVEFAIEIFDVLVEYFEVVWELISTVTTTVWDALKDAWDVFLTTIMWVWDHFGDSIMAAVAFVWNTIKTVVMTVINVVKEIIAAVTAAIQGDWDEVWERIQSILSTVWDAIWSIIGEYIGLIKTFISDWLTLIWGWIKDKWDAIKESISTALDNIWTAIKDAWNHMWDSIVEILGNIGDSITGAWDDVKRSLKEINLFDIGKQILNTLWEGIKNVGKSITSWASNFNPFSKLSSDEIGEMSLTRQVDVNVKNNTPDRIASRLDHVMKLADTFSDPILPDFSSSFSAAPSAGTETGYRMDGGVGNVTIHIARMEVRDDRDITRISQALYDRMANKGKTRGNIILGN